MVRKKEETVFKWNIFDTANRISLGKFIDQIKGIVQLAYFS